MTRSLLKRKFLWRHISKSTTTNNFKFCVFTNIIRTIIGSKFQVDPITVILFSGSGPTLPPIPLKSQNAVGYRVKPIYFFGNPSCVCGYVVTHNDVKIKFHLGIFNVFVV